MRKYSSTIFNKYNDNINNNNKISNDKSSDDTDKSFIIDESNNTRNKGFYNEYVSVVIDIKIVHLELYRVKQSTLDIKQK